MLILIYILPDKPSCSPRFCPHIDSSTSNQDFFLIYEKLLWKISQSYGLMVSNKQEDQASAVEKLFY